jgi:hypothetical protein
MQASFYKAWRDHKLKTETSNPMTHEFMSRLLQGRVSRFDLTQQCNMGGAYTRCFYQLDGCGPVYEEAGCRKPFTRWRTAADCEHDPAEAELWAFIRRNFTRTAGKCQEVYVAKKPQEDYCAHDHCAEFVSPGERFCSGHANFFFVNAPTKP